MSATGDSFDGELRKSSDENGLALIEDAKSKGLQVELIRQLNKDFAMSGIDAVIDEQIAPVEVVGQLNECVEVLIRDDFQGFLNLLYRVDVPQSKMQQTPGGNFSDYIEKATYQLLKREWQKVWIRKSLDQK
jgi:hypothetical protein